MRSWAERILEGVTATDVALDSSKNSDAQRALRLFGQRRKEHRVALPHIFLEIMITERAGVDALDPGQSAGSEIGRGAQARQLFQDCEACLGTFEGYGEFGSAGPSADGKHLAPNLPDARVAPLDDMRRMRQAFAKGVIVFADHGATRGGARSSGLR